MSPKRITVAILLAVAIAAPSIGSAIALTKVSAATAETFGQYPQGYMSSRNNQLISKCPTVTAKVYNRYVRELDAITGKRHHRASRKVCKSHFDKLKVKIRAARAACKRLANHAIASHYGRGDGFLGGPLACGGHLYAGQIGTAHKYLPCGTILYMKDRKGNGLKVRVIDRGPFVAGRDFDLTSWTADRIGIGGVGSITYSRRNCWT